VPEHLKALIVILALAAVTFAFARGPACAIATDAGDFARRRNAWLGVTAAAFLAHNFWVYIVAAAAILFVAARREPNRPAMYFLLLFAVPAIPAQIPGFGVIQHFFTIDWLRLLSLMVLLPAFLVLRNQPGTERFGSTFADKLLAAYLVLQILLMFTVSSFTNMLRVGVFYAFIDVFLPYYVASRALRTLPQFRDALMGFVLAALLLAATGAFEVLRHWLLYASLDRALDVYWDLGDYLARGGEDLRALGTTGQPIPFGYVMAVAGGFLLYLARNAGKPLMWGLAAALLGAGMLAALSRGPWVGAAAIVVLYIATGPGAARSFAKLALLLVLAVPLLMATDGGQRVIDLLPFVGSAGSDTVTYRQQLATISLQVILANPFFGAFDYIYSPAMQDLKQGQGIVDIVNTYLSVGLGNGMVGLALFTGFFLSIAVGIFRAMRGVADRNDERHTLGRALLATLLGIMVTIATVSSITVIPVIYWSVAGLGAGYALMLARSRAPQHARGAARAAAGAARRQAPGTPSGAPLVLRS